MQINDIYELIPWETLKKWAETVKFNESIINTNFPKYENWSEKAVYADFLMDHIDEGLNYENIAYPKAGRIQAQDLTDSDFVETYKLYFDSCRAEENYANTDAQTLNWNMVYLEMCGYVELGRGVEAWPYVACTAAITAAGIELVEDSRRFRARFGSPSPPSQNGTG